MKIPKIVILDEKDKRLHQVSEPVTFPLDDETKKLIYSFGSNIIKGRKLVLSAQSATYILL